MNIKGLFGDAIPIIQKFAPSVASAITSPIGFAAGYIIPILASAFGTSSRDLNALAGKIFEDPDAAEKLAAIEHDHGDWLCGILQSVTHLSSADIHIKLEWQKKL